MNTTEHKGKAEPDFAAELVKIGVEVNDDKLIVAERMYSLGLAAAQSKLPSAAELAEAVLRTFNRKKGLPIESDFQELTAAIQRVLDGRKEEK